MGTGDNRGDGGANGLGKRRVLTGAEWESVCEYVDERRASGAGWPEIEEEVGLWGILEERDLAGLERRHREWSRAERRRQERLCELPEQMAVAAKPERERERGRSEEVRQAVLYVCGPGILRPVKKWKWKAGPNRTLKPGEVATEVRGMGESWLVCAVIISKGDGTREVLPEHRIRSRIPAGKWIRSKGETIRMQVLELHEELDERGILRRVAAAAYGYFAEGSGVRSGQELGARLGVSRQAVNIAQQKLRRDHAARGGRVAALAGHEPGRRPGKGKRERREVEQEGPAEA